MTRRVCVRGRAPEVEAAALQRSPPIRAEFDGECADVMMIRIRRRRTDDDDEEVALYVLLTQRESKDIHANE